MEGLYDPFKFKLPNTIDKKKVLTAIVKVRPKRTLEYNFFSTDAEADAFSATSLDQDGCETIQYGFVESDKLKCSDPEFSQALFTHEFCELIKTNTTFPTKTNLLGHGNGVFVSQNGYIATNFHLVSGSVEHLRKLDGYFDNDNLLIKNIEIEYPVGISDSEIQYTTASKVYLAGTYSKKDAYGNRLDLAILKIDEQPLSFLPIAKNSAMESNKIFSLGFSMRTARSESSKSTFGYEDASYDLRISVGEISKLDGENSFLANTDGAPGNSGSAAINEQGELIGIYCGSTGNGIVDSSKSFRRYVSSSKLSQLFLNKA